MIVELGHFALILATLVALILGTLLAFGTFATLVLSPGTMCGSGSKRVAPQGVDGK